MNKIGSYSLIFIIAILFFSCENEIGRIDFTNKDKGEIQFDLEKDREVKIWTEIDIEYIEKPLFVYDFEFYKGDEFLLKGGTDPLVAMNKRDEVLTTEGGRSHWKFYGKIEGNFIAKEDGRYTFKTTFIKNKNPDLKINKIAVVFQQ